MASHPGLDPTYLAARRRPHPATAQLPARTRTHLDAHDGYVAFSGGKDSLVTLHLALAADPNVPVVFFDSGLEYPETYQYIAELTTRWNLQLHTLHPRHSALDILAASGTWDHHATSTPTPDLHTTLITDPAAQAHTAHGPGELWGVRAQESRGRAALYATALRAEVTRHCTDCCTSTDHPRTAQRRHHGGVVRRIDGTVAFGPIWDWKTTDVWAHITRHDLPVNPVYTKLRHLGAPEHASRVSHMLDGNHLEQGRATWLRRGWPAIFDELAAVLPRLREFV